MSPSPKASKTVVAVRLATAAAPIVLGLLAGYVYDIRPMVHDICEALLPFGTVAPSVAPDEKPDAG